MINTEDVVIVGGGPVGLFMGICLRYRNIPCTIIEKRSSIVEGSRSLGIHPVSLDLFEKLDLLESFLSSGLKVTRGFAHTGSTKLGDLSFEELPFDHKYILVCPQYETEKILRDHFLSLAPDGLLLDTEVVGLEQHFDHVSLSLKQGETTSIIETGYVIGCDGKHSFVRETSGIAFKGKTYKDSYIMGDFNDTSSFEDQAAIFLPKNGLIECFPLPDNKRRWVVKTPEYISEPTPELLAEFVSQRIRLSIPVESNSMISSFGVQHYLADQFVKDRVLLVGDAAHVVSPIGGQGMNLGWLDAWHLANVMSFCRGISKDLPIADLFVYESKQKPMAKKVARRAELNMSLGRRVAIPALRNQIVKAMLTKPLKSYTARLFTMYGLEDWWI